MKTHSKRSLSENIEIPFVRMLMVFHNKDSEPTAVQIAENMISKRLKSNFNDRVFDIEWGTIIDHTAKVSINFYKVFCLTANFKVVSFFQTFEKEAEQTTNEVKVSFILENEYICNNPDAFGDLYGEMYSSSENFELDSLSANCLESPNGRFDNKVEVAAAFRKVCQFNITCVSSTTYVIPRITM